MVIIEKFSSIFVNLCFVYNLYILKLIDIYFFFTYAVFENMERNKIKICYIYKFYNYYRYFLSIIYMNFVMKIKKKRNKVKSPVTNLSLKKKINNLSNIYNV